MRRLPIVRQIMALVVLATLVASAAMVAITFAGPPPKRAPEQVAKLAAVLAGEAAPMPGVVRQRQQDPPVQPPGMRRDRMLEREIADLAGCASCTVVAYVAGPILPGRDAVAGDYLIALGSVEGEWTVVDSGADPALSRWKLTTATTVGIVLAAILVIASIVARSIVRPIEALGEAAEHSRPGEEWFYEAPAGPPEVRAAALALGDLHARNLEHAQERLTMLAAISHDVGTPLARLAFRVENLPDDARDAALSDIEAIRRMLGDTLTLARGWSGSFERISLRELCEDIVAREREQGHPVSLGELEELSVDGDPSSLERMVQNLVDNALRYGKTARLSLRKAGDRVVLAVSDSGPGFVGLLTDDLLKPFVRGETSRNAASGGSGLGLAIAAQIAARHGGGIALETGEAGGGIVFVTLPAAGPGSTSAWNAGA